MEWDIEISLGSISAVVIMVDDSSPDTYWLEKGRPVWHGKERLLASGAGSDPHRTTSQGPEGEFTPYRVAARLVGVNLLINDTSHFRR